MNGFINLLKTPGITSSTAVSIIKKTYNIKKVGHAGTLDPGAAGVLPIMINRATRLFDYLQDESKEYIAEFVFGTDTDTLDMQGSVLAQNDAEVTQSALEKIIPQFIGTINQRPPKVSAVNINGKKAYKLQRENAEFEIPEKEVIISSVELIRKTAYNSFLLKIGCSKGTYIRSLCRDMAQMLGTYGYINYLLRTKSSGFSLENALSVEQLKETPLEQALVPIDTPISHILRVDIKKKYLAKAKNGLSVPCEEKMDGITRVYCDGDFIGLGQKIIIDDIQNIKIFKRLTD